MAYDWTSVFTDMGKVIKTANDADVQTTLETDKTALETIFDDDADDITYLADVIAAVDIAKLSSEAATQALVTSLKKYMRTLLREKLQITYTSIDDIVDKLVELMNDETETVDGNVTHATPLYDEINDGSNQLSIYEGITGLSWANTDHRLKVYIKIIDDGAGFYHVDIYNDAAMAGGDLIAHTATYNSTGAKALIADNTSGIGGTITVDAVTAADADIEVQFHGGLSRVGTGYVDTWATTQMAHDEDDVEIRCASAGSPGSERWAPYSREHGSQSDRGTTGVVFPSSSQDDLFGIQFTIQSVDTDGDDEALVYYDGSVITSLAVSGGNRGVNCDIDGISYCKLLSSGVTTETEANDGSNQLSGYDGVTGVSEDNVDASHRMYFEVVDEGAGNFRVDIFKDVARANLIGHTGTYTGAGIEAITADNTSGLGGTITIDVVTVADVDIYCIYPMWKTEMYSDSARSALVAESEYIYTTNTNLTDETVAEANSSGLSGTFSIVGGTGSDDIDIEALLAIDFALDDGFTFGMESDEAGTFQGFFRDWFQKVLPSETDGSETVSDALAE